MKNWRCRFGFHEWSTKAKPHWGGFWQCTAYCKNCDKTEFLGDFRGGQTIMDSRGSPIIFPDTPNLLEESRKARANIKR